MIETYEQKRRRLFGRQNMQSFLKELNAIIINGNVNESNLCSIVETDSILKQCFDDNKKTVDKIAFSEKERLKEIVCSSQKNTQIGYFIFIKNSEDCGLFYINSLNMFNFEFSYDSVAAGLIILIREDFKMKIIFDFFEESSTKYLEIEIYSK